MNFLAHRWQLDRRTFLRGSGVALALPWLEAMSPASKSIVSAGEAAAGEIPKRAVFTFWGLGLNGRDYTPATEGRDYQATPILQPIDKHRDDSTIITGLKLNYSGGHGGDRTFLTGNCTHKADTKLHVSVDQQLAEYLGNATRFKSLVLGIQRGTGFGNAQDNTLSWSSSGTPLPAENRPDVLFDLLFRKETPEQLAAREKGYRRQAGILDAVAESAARLQDRVGVDDRRKLDEYFTSIREIERRMAGEKEWLHREKPPVAWDGTVPKIEPQQSKTFDYRTYQRLMYDIIALVLQTDGTRVISYMAKKDLGDGTGSYGFLGNPYDYHTLTHHGEDPERLKWLTQVDIWHMEDWCYFLDKLKSIKEGSGTLLDHVLLARSSSGGTLNAHNNTMLPTILHGGSRIGVKHQGHITATDKSLGNLWRTMVQLMGMPLPEQFMGGESDGVIGAIL
jgi:hypothetical protein